MAVRLPAAVPDGAVLKASTVGLCEVLVVAEMVKGK